MYADEYVTFCNEVGGRTEPSGFIKKLQAKELQKNLQEKRDSVLINLSTERNNRLREVTRKEAEASQKIRQGRQDRSKRSQPTTEEMLDRSFEEKYQFSDEVQEIFDADNSPAVLSWGR